MKKSTGFTLIETLIAVAVLAIIVFGVIGALAIGIKIIGRSKARVGATSLVNKRMEMIRNLAYKDIGTIKGFVSGPIPQEETITLNGIEYTLKTSIDYFDDPADGEDVNDENENTADYKKVRVEVNWSGKYAATPVVAVSNFVPKGIETDIAGGTLIINVLNASVQPVGQANLHIVNEEMGVDTNKLTNDQGRRLFQEVQSVGKYEVTVTKSGYSTARTYDATEENPNPDPGHLTILEGKTTEKLFYIDLNSSLTINTVEPKGESIWNNYFVDSSKVAESSNMDIGGGEAKLSKTDSIEFTEGTIDGDLCAFPGIDGDCGQSFTMGSESRTISRVQLYLRKATDDPSDIYLEIRKDNTVGEVLASSILIDSATLLDTLDWVVFDLQNSVTLSANTQYFLRLRSDPDSTNPEAGAVGTIYWGYGSGYTGEGGWTHIGKNNNPSNPGVELIDTDFSFKIYQGQYYTSGYLISTTITPDSLVNWIRFSWNDEEPENTDIKYQVFYYNGADWVLLPEDVLPGNTAGFDDSPKDLSGLDIVGYAQLRVRGDFLTTDTSFSPTLFDWQVRWNDNVEVSLGNVSFTMTGAKTIGEGVYKYSQIHTTNSVGYLDIYNLEWDVYDIHSTKIGSQFYDISASLPPEPKNIEPNTSDTLKLTLVFHANHTLLVTVKNAAGDLLTNTSARLFRIGYDETILTGESGQSFFTPLVKANDYSLRVSNAGYQDYSLDNVEVDGQSEITVIMTTP